MIKYLLLQETLEEEIKVLYDVLKTQSVGMEDPLVDNEGRKHCFYLKTVNLRPIFTPFTQTRLPDSPLQAFRVMGKRN